jgi:hypothetical protein
VFDGFSEYDTGGTRSLLLSTAQKPITSARLADALHELVRDNPQRLAVRQDVAAARERQHRRRAHINTISVSGKFTNYPLWSSAHGGFKWLLCSTLENESDEMLAALAERVPSWRVQIKHGSVKEESIPDSDSMGELNTRPEQVELPNDEFLAFPGDPSREYTPREAKQNLRELMFFPNSNQGRGPRRVAAINRLLSGRKYGER